MSGFYACLLYCLLLPCYYICRLYDGHVSSDSEKQHTLSVAFYNLDNLYDDIDDVDHDDGDFTPSGKYQWTKERYHQKLKNMAGVISKIADGNCPDVIGVCELESRKALQDLLNTGKSTINYGIAHFDSPDERGIDVALAYNREKISVLHSEKIPVVLSTDLKDKTRDQLYVLALNKKTGDTMHFYICHFPSRREGKAESEINRIDAAKACRSFIDSHMNLKTANLIILGDFNDEPWDKSISKIIGAGNIKKDSSSDLLNLMWNFSSQKRGTYKYKDKMNILDQVMISAALNDKKGLEYKPASVNIFDAAWLTQKGKYEGYPLRTFGGDKWLNGYSDHYAVYISLMWQ